MTSRVITMTVRSELRHTLGGGLIFLICCKVGDEVERPLTADETRRLQREWRARYKGRKSKDVS